MRWEDLEPWQQRFWSFVFARHPEFAAHLYVADYDGREVVSLELPCPGAEDTGPFWLTVESFSESECEATIGLFAWHGHYELGPQDLDGLADDGHSFWQTLSGILEERLVLRYTTDARGYTAGSLMPLEDALTDGPASSWLPRGGGGGIRSWRGTHDREWDAPSAE